MSTLVKNTINEALETIKTLPWSRKVNAIIDFENPKKLIEQLSALDLLLMLREVGVSDCLEIIELLSSEKVQEILDLDVWHNDSLDAHKAGNYFSLLFEANEQRAISQIYGLDIELLGLMLKTVSHIYDTTLGEEPVEYPDLYSLSPDGRFIVCFSDATKKRSLSQSLHVFLERLYGRNLEFALSLLESTRFEMASGLEEAAHRLKEGRLLDFGIVPHEERLEFFTPIELRSINKETQSPLMPLTGLKPLITHESLSAHKMSDFPFLARALEDLHEQASEILSRISYAAMNMHASLSPDFGELDALKTTLSYAKALIEIALVQATFGDISKAATILQSNSVKNLIRLGRTPIVHIRKLLTSKKGDQTYLFGKDFCFLDSPLREVAKALSLAEPRFYEGLSDPKKLTLRYFSSLSEIALTLRATHEICFRALLLGPRGVGFLQESLESGITHAELYGAFLVNKFFDKPKQAKLTAGEIALVSTSSKTAFEIFAKNVAHELALSLHQQGFYPLGKAEEHCSNFTTTVLVNLAKNADFLRSEH